MYLYLSFDFLMVNGYNFNLIMDSTTQIIQSSTEFIILFILGRVYLIFISLTWFI